MPENANKPVIDLQSIPNTLNVSLIVSSNR